MYRETRVKVVELESQEKLIIFHDPPTFLLRKCITTCNNVYHALHRRIYLRSFQKKKKSEMKGINRRGCIVIHYAPI